MKAEHEARIAVVAGIDEDRASHVIRFGASICDNEALVSTQAVFSAMPPERHPANGQTLDLEMVGCAFRDDEPAYWTLQQENLRRQFDAKVRGALSLRRSDTSASSRSRRSHVASALPPVT
jgi:hypothetical protein